MPESNQENRPLPRPASRTTLREMIDNRVAVVALLFLVTGVLGIPILWMNCRFSLTSKIVLSIVTTVYTAALFWGTWMAVRMALDAMAPVTLS